MHRNLGLDFSLTSTNKKKSKKYHTVGTIPKSNIKT